MKSNNIISIVLLGFLMALINKKKPKTLKRTPNQNPPVNKQPNTSISGLDRQSGILY